LNRILILGASGFIGNALYKELRSYFDTYGTFFSSKSATQNNHLFHFNIETDDIEVLLNQIKPSYIIAALRGDFEAQLETHAQLAAYLVKKESKIIFLSSANVFDAFSNYPSYEYDKTLSESSYGKLKIKIENQLLKLPEHKYVIARLPMVFGYNSPRIRELKEALQHQKPYEVFPNVVMNATHIAKLVQQIHYIINQNSAGIFHLGSKDVVHHDAFIKEIIEKSALKNLFLKNVYTSNFDRFLAVLPKGNALPQHLHCTIQQVIENSILSS
jgi:dTDP-4-dehydrorhamnose reductase